MPPSLKTNVIISIAPDPVDIVQPAAPGVFALAPPAPFTSHNNATVLSVLSCVTINVNVETPSFGTLLNANEFTCSVNVILPELPCDKSIVTTFELDVILS